MTISNIIELIKNDNKERAIKELTLLMLKESKQTKRASLYKAVTDYIKHIDQYRENLQHVITARGYNYLCDGYSLVFIPEITEDIKQYVKPWEMMGISEEVAKLNPDTLRPAEADGEVIRSLAKYNKFAKAKGEKFGVVKIGVKYFNTALLARCIAFCDVESVSFYTMPKADSGIYYKDGSGVFGVVLPLRISDEHADKMDKMEADFIQTLQEAKK